MTVIESFEKFIESRQLADLSPRTIDDYKQFITPFVEAVGLHTDIHKISQERINEYIQSILKRPLSKATKATYIRHIKIYLRWCENTYDTLYTTKNIKVPKTPKKNVQIYTAEEVNDIFKSIHAESPWLVYRNRCIIALMYDSGLRQNEVCHLMLKNISFTSRTMIVYGKGNKERTVPLGKLTEKLMKQYIDACPFELDTLFVSRHGEALTCNAVKLFISKLADELPFELSSHKLRHNFATNYCIDQYERYGQVDIYKLMYLLGHEELNTTKRYLHQAMNIIAARGNISHLDNVLTGEI